MKKKLIVIVGFLLLMFGLTSCFNETTNLEQKDNNINKKQEQVENKKEDNKISKKEVNKEGRHIEPVIKVKSKSDKKLAQIEEEINAENEKIQKERTEKIEKVKSVIRDYFSRVNSDKDIIELVDQKSINKIQKNTEQIYKLLSDDEKKQFIKELREYGFLKENFNPSNKDDINKYINFVIKAGYRNLGEGQGIKKVEFSNFTEIVDKETDETIYFMQVSITFNNKEVKKVKLFLNNKFKIIIAN